MWDQFSVFFNNNDHDFVNHDQPSSSGFPLRSEKFRRQVNELSVLFPDCDPLYLEYCCHFYKDNHVERICEKIFISNHTHYPQLPPQSVKNSKNTETKNFYLDTISIFFPDCDLTYLRELVSTFSHSVTYRAIEHLISQNNKYPRRPHFGRIEKNDYFKTVPYKRGSYCRLLNLFPKVPKSSIKGILAETNYNFLESYDRLSLLAIRHNWVTSLLNYFSSRKPLDEPSMYTMELLEELSIIESRGKTVKVDTDLVMAQNINQFQYEKEKQTISCGCCYVQFTFEELCQCNEGHLFCRECVNRYVTETVHGQSNFKERGVIPCIDTGGCLEQFSEQELCRALEPDLYNSYQKALFEMQIEQSHLTLARCPFCHYVEVDQEISLRKLQWRSYILFGVAYTALRRMLSSWSLLSKLLFPLHLFFLSLTFLGFFELSSYNLVELLPSTLIPKFLLTPPICSTLQCRAPDCGKLSCRLCFQQCLPSHQCLENKKDELRLKIEQAMADAVKRTCPDCNLSFTKLDGCNKMTCRCGYIMCYLCRQGIKDVLYGHFCDHFRFNPGESCKECNKCDLYRDPNDEAAMAKAVRAAKKAFLQDHPELIRQPSNSNSVKSKQQKHIQLSALEEFYRGFTTTFFEQAQDRLIGWFFY